MICGADPGFSGALAWYDEKIGKLIRLEPMPLVDDKGLVFTTKSAKKQICAPTLARLIGSFTIHIFVLEKVDASPQMGVVSAFRFGEGFGLIKGILAAQEIVPKLAYPSSWKTAMGLSSDKKMSTDLACKLFPEWSEKFLAGKKSADFAEAALLAKFGERFIIK